MNKVLKVKIRFHVHSSSNKTNSSGIEKYNMNIFLYIKTVRSLRVLCSFFLVCLEKQQADAACCFLLDILVS